MTLSVVTIHHLEQFLVLSRQTLVDLEEHVKPILYPDSGGKKASVEARSPKKLPGESKKTENKSHADLLLSEMQSKKSLDAPIESDEEDYSYQVPHFIFLYL